MWLTDDITKIPPHLKWQFLIDMMYIHGLRAHISNLLRDEKAAQPPLAPDPLLSANSSESDEHGVGAANR